MSDKDWESFRDAGELWGRLRKELGFGEVDLCQDELGMSDFKLLWRFRVNGKTYSAGFVTTAYELASVATIKGFAKRIASRWKSDARRKLGSETPKRLAD